jgi:DNA-binding NarL/FixJ family response regulator
MTTPTARTLIVSRSGPVGLGLRAIVRTFPRIGAIEQVTDLVAARQIVQTERPTLAVLDVLPDDAAPELVRWIKQVAPTTRCLVVAGSVDQQRRAERAGVDAVLLEGPDTPALVAAIDRLLADA